MKKILFLAPLVFSTFLFSNQVEKESKVNDFVKKEEVLFEINKIYQIEKIDKVKRHDEYVCNFGMIDISNNKFKMALNLDEKASTSFDEQSYRYYLNHQSDIHAALKLFFKANINGNYCKPNENLVYDNPKDKVNELEKSSNIENKFNGYKIVSTLEKIKD